MNTKQLFSGLLLASALALPAGANAAGADRETVWDARGNPVLDFRGNCVRTNWPAGQDPCARESIVNAQIERPLAELSEYERTVYFEFDRAELTPDARAKLDNIARTVSGEERILSGDIVGHADRIGTSDYNQRLSARRAQVVKEYLASRGFVNTQVVDVAAAGESQPVTGGCEGEARNQAIECLQPDRRVEVRLQTATDTARATTNGYVPSRSAVRQ